MKALFVLLTTVGLIGVLSVFIWTIFDKYVSTSAAWLSYLVTIVAMILILSGLHGLKQLKERREP